MRTIPCTACTRVEYVHTARQEGWTMNPPLCPDCQDDDPEENE
jgi:hypothetical protein